MARILIAGAGSYIGIPLFEELGKRGHEVWGFDRWFFGKKPMGIASGIYADIRTFDPRKLPEMDVVIDLAGLSNDASADIDPELTTSINLHGACRLATLAKEAGTRRYIYSSSCSVYGAGERSGLSEGDDPNPLTSYARSKVGVEDHLRSIASPDFDPIILRNATVFGVSPRMRFDLAVNIMTLRAWRDNLLYVMGGGQQVRPFVHVLDVVRAFVLAVERKEYTNDTFNVGCDSLNMSINELASRVKNVFPSAVIHNIPDDPDKRSYDVSFHKIKKDMQFKVHHDVTMGICEVRDALIKGRISGDDETCYTLNWYRKLMDWDQRLKEIRLDGRIL